jgi:hypothetical protein
MADQAFETVDSAATRMVGLKERFAELPDSRSTINRRHLLVDVVVISVCGVLAGAKFLSIDGKTLRRSYGGRSHDRQHQLGALHLVSVWANEQGVTLGQVATFDLTWR